MHRRIHRQPGHRSAADRTSAFRLLPGSAEWQKWAQSRRLGLAESCRSASRRDCCESGQAPVDPWQPYGRHQSFPEADTRRPPTVSARGGKQALMRWPKRDGRPYRGICPETGGERWSRNFAHSQDSAGDHPEMRLPPFDVLSGAGITAGSRKCSGLRSETVQSLEPPSTWIVSSVIQRAASEARKAKTCPTSSGSPMRCRAWMLST